MDTKKTWSRIWQQLTSPLLDRYLSPPDDEVYQTVMKKRGLQPEVVQLPHDTEGYWIGNKNAKNVVVFYHGKSNYTRRSSPSIV